jgi:uncharacterized membrane protein
VNLSDGLISPLWLWLGHLIYWPLLLHAIYRAPWRHLSESESLHVLLGATVGVLVLWNLNAGVEAGLNLHLLGATLLTLMFGRQFALICLSLVLLAVTVNNASGWSTFALNAVVVGVLPVWVSYRVFRAVDRYLPNNFFVYIFGCAFFGAALSMATVGVVSTGVLGLADVYTVKYLLRNYLPFFILMLFPEGFVTGMLMTLLVVYRPQWVSTFSDERYIKNK